MQIGTWYTEQEHKTINFWGHEVKGQDHTSQR